VIRIHSVIHGTRANGPELRTGIWLQGCQGMNCPGCQNPLTHSSAGGSLHDPREFARHVIMNCAVGTRGVTFSGGEPMQQADSMLQLILALKAYRPEWSFGMFSGYTLRELSDGRYWVREEKLSEPWKRQLWMRLKARLDFAILGRYDRDKPVDAALDVLTDHRPDLPIVSSSNQTVELFSMRYTHVDFPRRAFEVIIGEDGLTQITGFPQ
jgi:hypothetical protein